MRDEAKQDMVRQCLDLVHSEGLNSEQVNVERRFIFLKYQELFLFFAITVILSSCSQYLQPNSSQLPDNQVDTNISEKEFVDDSDEKESYLMDDGTNIYICDQSGVKTCVHEIEDTNSSVYFFSALNGSEVPAIVVVDPCGNGVGAVHVYKYDPLTNHCEKITLYKDGKKIENSIFYGLAKGSLDGELLLAERIPDRINWCFRTYEALYEPVQSIIDIVEQETYCDGTPSWW